MLIRRSKPLSPRFQSVLRPHPGVKPSPTWLDSTSTTVAPMGCQRAARHRRDDLVVAGNHIPRGQRLPGRYTQNGVRTLTECRFLHAAHIPRLNRVNICGEVTDEARRGKPEIARVSSTLDVPALGGALIAPAIPPSISPSSTPKAATYTNPTTLGASVRQLRRHDLSAVRVPGHNRRPSLDSNTVSKPAPHPLPAKSAETAGRRRCNLWPEAAQ